MIIVVVVKTPLTIVVFVDFVVIGVFVDAVGLLTPSSFVVRQRVTAPSCRPWRCCQAHATPATRLTCITLKRFSVKALYNAFSLYIILPSNEKDYLTIKRKNIQTFSKNILTIMTYNHPVCSTGEITNFIT